MRKLNVVVCGIFAIATILPAVAADDLLEAVTVSGGIEAFYAYDLTEVDNGSGGTEMSGANGFDIGLASITIDGKITENVSAAVTVDVTRGPEYDIVATGVHTDSDEVIDYYTYELIQTSNGSYDVFVDAAYFDVANLIPMHSIQFGMIGNPWIGYEEGIWGNAVIRGAALKEYGPATLSDLGIGILGFVVKDYVEHHLTFVNGIGNGTGENNKGKAIEYRLSAFPLASNPALKGLSVNGFVRYEGLLDDVEPAVTDMSFGGLLGFDHKYVTLGGGYFMNMHAEDDNSDTTDIDSSIITGYATGHVYKNIDLIARYDMVDPNADAEDDGSSVIVAGASYTFGGGHCRIIPNFQMDMPEDENTTENRMFFIHTEVGF